MAIIKCEVCGGELELNADMSVGICKYCDAVNVISKNLDRIGNLFNRAIFLRQNKEFDKAMEVYEDILKEDNNDAKAHWGLVLSKYGIEYVQDGRTGNYLPTCHRMQKGSILSDADYLAALENADFEGKRVYEEEGKKINEIHAKILEISRKEPPYDVFICYKETDAYGKRTEDSIIAQDIFYELEKKGYKVFFARKTLESKLGSEYEPVIFAALNSAKVMVVVGTKKEHFEAVWVRNEWNRFYKMSKDIDKVIIPAYKGISPYELPVELANFQALDISKIGFIYDLTDGIERCVRHIKKEDKVHTVEKIVKVPERKSLEQLLDIGGSQLKLLDYDAAMDAYMNATKDYPGDYRGWWGLIIAHTKNLSENNPNMTNLKRWLGNIKKLVDNKKYEELEEI